MKKLFTLLTLLLCVASSAWADDTDLIVSWATTPTLSNDSEGCTETGNKNNVATWSDGTSIKIMRSDKDMSNGGNITIGSTSYKSIKVSNGAQNLLTMPSGKKAYSVTIYSYINADSGNCYWREVNGDKTQTTSMTSYKDGDNPDVRTYNLGGVSSFTFTNAGKQLCYVMVISTVAKQQATLSFETTSGDADLANGTSFTLPTLTKNPTDLAVTFSSTNENVATVNATSGAVTLTGVGTTTIKASFKGNSSYYAATAEYELTVTNSSITTISVTYDISNVEGIVGYAPSSFTIDEGESFTIPANQTLYVEGKTLTGWSSGATIYGIGDEVTAPGTDLTLVPNFEDNSPDAYLGHNASSITWNFKKSTGAPLWDQLQGTGATTIYVAQTTIGSNKIDVKMDMDATNGKIDNSANDNWTQMNTGTKLTVPVVKGSTLELKVYKEGTTPVTFGGVDGTYNSNLYTYTATEAGNLDIVMGENDQSYCEYLTVTYPSESAVYTHVQDNTQILLTKANIVDKDYLAVNTDNWQTNKTYGGIQGDFYNMSQEGRQLTIKVTGANKFEVYVQNTNSGRTYSVTVGNAEAVNVTHSASGVESSVLFEIDDPTAVTTITLKGNNGSVYPVYLVFNPTKELTTTATMGGWKSFYDADNGYTLDENTKAYVATKVEAQGESDVVVLNEIDAVPAATAVLLKTTNQVTTSTDNHYSMTLTKDNVEPITTDNMLKLSSQTNYNQVYRLGADDEGVGFFKYIKGDEDVVILDYDASSNAGARGLTIAFADDETTASHNVNDNVNLNKVVFDLQGRRVLQPGKGLYIVNGKKVVIK